MGCKEGCSKEFQCSNLGLTHTEPDLFVSPQGSCWHRLPYVIYRFLAFIYFFVWIVLSGEYTKGISTTEANRVKWFIYLTNWAFFTLTFSLLVQAILAFIAADRHRRYHLKSSPIYTEMTWFLKAGWVIYNMAAAISITVSLAYWLLLYSPSSGIDAVDFSTHASNSMMVLVDLFVVGTPLRIYHMIHPVLWGVVYVLFSVAFTLAGGTGHSDQPYIYKVLDWNTDPGNAALYGIIIVLVVIPVVWLILYGLYRLRLVIYNACSCGGNTVSHLSGKETELGESCGIDNEAMEP